VAYNARRCPNAPALENADTGAAQTWAQTEDRVGRMASVLAERLSVGPGDRVVLLTDNDPRVVEVQFACWRLGAVFVPLNFRLASAELAHCLTDAEPAALIHDASWAELAYEAMADAGSIHIGSWGGVDSGVDIDAAIESASHRGTASVYSLDQPAQLLYTSGTSGRPKGAICTLGTLIWHSLNIAGPCAVSGEGDRHLAALPLFHAGGLNGVTNPVLLGGGCVQVAARFVPQQCLDLLGDPAKRVTHFSGPPFAYLAMSQLPGFDHADFSFMRYGQLGGGYLERDMAEEYAKRGAHLLSTYGATEMGPSVTSVTTARALDKIGSCGFPVQHTQIRLVKEDGADAEQGEVGEMWVRGPAITPGYWGRDPATDPSFADGWFRSGDALWTDEDGFFFLTGRYQEMYKSGGENVFTAEVEDLLIRHPDIVEVGIIGVPHPKWSQTGRAVIVARQGTNPTVESIADFASGKLAKYKLPTSVVLTDALPRTGSGKLARAKLKETFGGDIR
jgi:fatty-acyl-CoA synthase